VSARELARAGDTVYAGIRDTAGAYEERYGGLMDQVGARLAELAPPDADPGEVARVIVRYRRIGLDDLLRSRRALQA
jgi:hypothetical protein